MPAAAPAMTSDPRNVVRGTSAASGIVALDDAECRALLARQRLCILACVDDGLPYALPMFYGYAPESGALFLGISEGRKTEVLDANPHLMLTVTETGPGDTWRSVLVTGTAEWVAPGPERDAAVRALMAHNRRPERAAGASADGASADGAAPAAPPRRHGTGRILRVADMVLAGRAKT